MKVHVKNHLQRHLAHVLCQCFIAKGKVQWHLLEAGGPWDCGMHSGSGTRGDPQPGAAQPGDGGGNSVRVRSSRCLGVGETALVAPLGH